MDRLRRARRSGNAPIPSAPGRTVRGGAGPGLFRVRMARPQDFSFVKKVSRSVFRVYGPYDRILRQWFDLGLTVTLIAVEGRRPVGFAMVGPSIGSSFSPRDAELLAIAVSPAEQGRGVGPFLLRTAEEAALSLGAETLVLHTASGNLRARKLFARRGYELVGRRQDFYPNGQEALELRKRLVSVDPEAPPRGVPGREGTRG
ncbi:MAG: GNAT family N-acetyltransferase [Deltaproteobacteria bacterium]|nr:GNAT family N-acetyltransferase [Deltaproteobacteria bacterium]MBW2103688.1 GNAT family N-acetyltransferase [Deltaproteobacteria bacterium]